MFRPMVTCSMKDVPYLRKYHHSKINIKPDINEDVPVGENHDQ
jgi:hypothetical protein